MNKRLLTYLLVNVKRNATNSCLLTNDVVIMQYYKRDNGDKKSCYPFVHTPWRPAGSWLTVLHVSVSALDAGTSTVWYCVQWRCQNRCD